MTTYPVTLRGYKHPDDVDWREVDFVDVLGDDTIASADVTASDGLTVDDQDVTPEGLVRVLLSGGAETLSGFNTLTIVTTTTSGRTLAADVRLAIKR